MNIVEARELLGDEFKNVPDSTIESIIHSLKLIAKLIVQKHLKERV